MESPVNKSIPAGAAVLLQFIYRTEVSREAPECYDVIYGHNEKNLPTPITKMTIDQIQAAQSTWSKKYGSSATGAYQFMRVTLGDLKADLKLSGSLIFTPDLQDSLGFELLKRRGYTEFMAGKLSRTEFGRRLAQEWASFPVLANTTGAKRTVYRGQSYYAGDGLNKSLVKPETVEAVLDKVIAAGNSPIGISPNINVAPTPIPIPEPIIVDAVKPIPLPEVQTPSVVNKTLGWGGIGLLLGSVVYGAWEWVSMVPCTYFGLACWN